MSPGVGCDSTAQGNKVKLLENEVSGTILSQSDVSQNYVLNLKRCLELRSVTTKGKKTKLFFKVRPQHSQVGGLCLGG